MTLRAEALPSDAPPMYHTAATVVHVVPIMFVRLSAGSDFPLSDSAIASFTLPPDELRKRGFAVQVFQVIAHKKHTDYKPLWTFNKSSLKDQTLTFSFTPPKMTIGKGSTYALVLYGDQKAASAAPSAAPDDGGAPPPPVPSPT